MQTRGTLPHVILSACGEDVRLCTSCWQCEDSTTPEMDLTLGELMQAVVRDEDRALTSRTLWACDPLLDGGLRCQQGIDLPAVIHALRQEAVRRGLAGGDTQSFAGKSA
jgi:heterodisulfide reductase subunit C